MRRLGVFNNVTLDGYFTSAKGDIDWAYDASPDRAWDKFVAGNAKGGGTLLLGRITYEMMVAWWPTPAAAEAMPDVAKGMNALQKIVFSRSLVKSDWENTRVVKSSPVAAVRKLKQEDGEDMVILGSGTIVALLTDAGLIDDYTLVVNPVVIGKGRTMFEGVKHPPQLTLVSTRKFKNGKIVLNYERAA